MRIKHRLDFSRIYRHTREEFLQNKSRPRIVPTIKNDKKESPFQCKAQAPIVELPDAEMEQAVFGMMDRIYGCKYSESITFLDDSKLSLPEKIAKEDLLFKELMTFINEVVGIQRFIQKFKENHLDDIIDGWIGNEINSDISPYQILQIFGIDKIHNIMKEIDSQDLQLTLKAISKLLPIIINTITSKEGCLLEDQLLFEKLIEFINKSGGLFGIREKFKEKKLEWMFNRWTYQKINSCFPSPFNFSTWEIYQIFGLCNTTKGTLFESLDKNISGLIQDIAGLFPVMINLLASIVELTENKSHTDLFSRQEVSHLAKKIQQLGWRKRQLSTFEKKWNNDCESRSAFAFDMLSTRFSRDSFYKNNTSYFAYRLDDGTMVGLVGTAIQEDRKGIEIKDLVTAPWVSGAAESLIEWTVQRAQEQENNPEGIVYLNAFRQKVPFYESLGFKPDPTNLDATPNTVPLILIPSECLAIWKKDMDGKYQLIKHFGKGYMS